MRCPECGYELGNLPGELACPECGTCSRQFERLPLPPEPKHRTFWGYAGVPLGASVIGLFLGVMLQRSHRDLGAPVGLFLLTLLGGGIVAAIMGFNTTHRLMQRLPRRVASAPFLLLIPRNVLISLLGAAATAGLLAALVSGACIAGALVASALR